MSGVKTSRIQNVNIVSTNYSRYGVSVYDRLYSSKSADKAGKSPGNASSSQSIYGHPNLSKTSSTASELDNDAATISTNNSRKSLIKRKYKSLFSASSKKLITKLYEHGSNSDSFSLFSHKPTRTEEHEGDEALFDVTNTPLIEQKQFSDLPHEVLKNIFGNLQDDQTTLVNCLYVNKAFYHAVKPVLYEEPKFTSTYRVAQFVTSVRTNPQNGAYVRVLDLSNLKNGVISEKSSGMANNTANTIATAADSPDFDLSNVITGRSRATSVTSLNSVPSGVSTNNASGKEVAYAGWRDWRYRHDPLYSSPLMNSYNSKRTLSRTPSLKSSSSSSSLTLFPNLLSKDGNSNSSTDNKSSDGSSGTFKRTRSNSSVSSITNSIMSSLYNGSHVSLNTTLSGSDSASTKSPSKAKPSNTSDETDQDSESNSTGDDTSTFGMTNDKNSRNASTWFRMKLRGTRTRRQRIKDKILEKESKKAKDSRSSSNEKVNKEVVIKRVQPFSTPHPYANKFLLKYAPYKDLPLGYILHILDHCPHLIELNLSNLVLCSDFEIIEKGKRKRFNSSLLLPAVQESVISTDTSDNLEVIYLTDSSKSYEHYDRMTNTNKHRRNSSMNGFWSTTSWNDGPAPIGANKNELKRTNSQNVIKSGVELRKLNESEIFQHIVQNHSADFATKLHVKIDNVVWCRQDAIKSFILQSFENEKEFHKDDISDLFGNDMTFSFEKSGLNRNIAWTCKGDLEDFVTLIVLEEVNKMDDLELENIFNIKAERHLEAGNSSEKAPEIYDVSNIFSINYGFQPNNQRTMKFRLTILKNEMPMTYAVRQMTDQYSSVVIDLQNNRNVVMPHPVTPEEEPQLNNNDDDLAAAVPENNDVADVNPITNEPFTTDPRLRIERVTQEIVARLKELRGSDLRRNIGENNYVREEFTI